MTSAQGALLTPSEQHRAMCSAPQRNLRVYRSISSGTSAATGVIGGSAVTDSMVKAYSGTVLAYRGRS